MNNKRRRTKCIKRKNKKLKSIVFIIVIALIIITFFVIINNQKENLTNNYRNSITEEKQDNNSTVEVFSNLNEKEKSNEKEQENQNKKIDDWRLTLVNYENKLPQDYKIELSNIDQIRKFDKRAIGELNNMIDDMREEGITNIWVQSAYRSIEYQQELYDNSINKYINQGYSEDDAKKLTEKLLAEPGKSEHNLGLAVDFNYVDETFENSKAYEWLLKNAENYGFILRYPKEKEEITKISYEPWHWRYVGQEHAKKMNELKMCLEEYLLLLIT